MSFEYYSKWWAATRDHLEDLEARDKILTKVPKSPIKDRNLAAQLIGGLYSKYSLLVQEMGVCFDQMAQPQKRETARKLMDAASVRLHELNEEMRKIDISEYHYIDGALIELKLVPQEVEILDPIFYHLRDFNIEDLWTKIKNGERIHTPPIPQPSLTLERASQTEHLAVKADGQPLPEGQLPPGKPPEQEKPPEETEKEKKIRKRPKKFVLEVKEMTAEEIAEEERKKTITNAIGLIQTAERGRQARIYFIEKYSVFKLRKAMTLGHKPPEIEPEEQKKSAVMIEKLWRGHAVRQMVRRKEKERRLLIGMTEPSWRSKADFEKMEANYQKRRDYRDQRIREYVEAREKEQTRVFRVIGPRLFEDIGDEIREWFYQWYIRAKNFDKYPDEEKGGSILVVRGETMTPEEWIEEVERKRRQKVKNSGRDIDKERKAKEKKQEAERKKKEAEKKKKEAEKKKKKKKKPGDYEMDLEESKTRGVYDAAIEEYHHLWDERKDMDNPEERHYFDIIHEEKCYQMQMEIRRQVDEMMRLELEMLQDALARDRAKGKKNKNKKKKNKKKKKKKKKKKGKKDPTAKRTTEDLFQELVDAGIIHPYPLHRLEEYKGDFSYNNWEFRNRDFDPPAALGDARMAVKINCIVPLSVGSIKKPRSVLICGPRQSGKHLLANIVFTETKCILFDLSPPILAGKYHGKKGMKMLLHLIEKMSRLLQPSIIFFDGAEKVFYKKVPKPERELEPKKMGKKLYKGVIKTIKPEDRVMVLGITGAPWLAKGGKLKKTYERIIMIPRPDYGSIYLYWRELLMPYHGVDRDFDVSCLAKVTKYFPLSVIRDVVNAVFTPLRIIQLYHKPLRQQELFEPFVNLEPITDKIWKKFEKFYLKTSLGKERKIYNAFAEIKREREAKEMEKVKTKR